MDANELLRKYNLTKEQAQKLYESKLAHQDKLNSSLSPGNGVSSPQGGIVNSLANSAPVNAILGAGDAYRNMLTGTASLLPGVNIAPVQSGEGAAYNLGNIAGNIGSFVQGGELLKGLPYFGKVAKSLSGDGLKGALGRVGGGALYGAVENPEDQVGGAEKGALFSGALESLPYALKGLKNTASFVSGKKAANEASDYISNFYNKQKDLASSLMNKSLDKFKNYNLTKANKLNNYTNVDDEYIKRYFLPDIKRLHEDFVKNPTFNNAFQLQKQLGYQIGKLSKKVDAESEVKLQALRQARKWLNNDLSEFLGKRNKSLAEDFQKGRDIFNEFVYPAERNQYLSQVANKEIQNPEAKDLSQYLEKAVNMPDKKLPESHYLTSALKKLNEQMNKGKLVQDAGGALSGALIGGGIGGPVGLATGGILGKILSSSMVDLASNPELYNAIIKLKKPYSWTRSAIVPNVLQGNKKQA